jgi:fructose-1,6-bisphosphatase/inositol monophosphatase family enzyme
MNPDFSFTQSDFRFLVRTIKKAGKTALTIQRSEFQVNRKSDTSIVTRADTETQDYIINRLTKRFPGINLIHEENFDSSVNSMSPDTLSAIIDPIDGTAMFSMHLPFWCVSLGIFAGYRPLYGFVYSPGCGMFFHNDNNFAFCNGRMVTAEKNVPLERETNIFCATEVPREYILSTPGKIRNLGSTALHASLLSDNRRNRTIAFLGSGFLWDWAGAIPVLLKSGCSLRYLTGREVDFAEVAANGYRFPEIMMAYSHEDLSIVRGFFGGKR